MKLPKFGNLSFILIAGCSIASIPAQTGGPFDLTHSVVASGGAASTATYGGQTFRVEGTIGQGSAGVTSVSTPARFSLHGGFWFRNLAPTAATVSLAGRVTNAAGQGIVNARLTLTSSTNVPRTITTGSLGYYSFTDVEVGQTYILQVSAKRFRFDSPTMLIDLADDIADANFVARIE